MGWAAGLVAVLAVATGSAASRGVAPPARRNGVAAAQALYRAELAALDRAMEALREAPTRQSFRAARIAYKRVEFLLAYQSPETAEVLNGPPVPTPHETIIHAEVPPTGLQVIEALVFAPMEVGTVGAIRAAVDSMRPTLVAVQRVRPEEAGADARLFDAVRLELARVSVLGIGAADATVSRDGIRESAEALRGVRQALAAYHAAEGGPATAWTALDARLAEAIEDL